MHSPNFEGTRITDGWLRDAEISGFIGGLRVNGVEVAPLVEAELDRRFPERVKLRAPEPQGLADAWAMIEDVSRTTVARARALLSRCCSSRPTASGALLKRFAIWSWPQTVGCRGWFGRCPARTIGGASRRRPCRIPPVSESIRANPSLGDVLDVRLNGCRRSERPSLRSRRKSSGGDCNEECAFGCLLR